MIKCLNCNWVGGYEDLINGLCPLCHSKINMIKKDLTIKKISDSL